MNILHWFRVPSAFVIDGSRRAQLDNAVHLADVRPREDTCTSGQFTTVTNYALGAGDTDPYNAIGIGDFNNDNKIDLVAIRKQAGSIYVLLGNGDGDLPKRAHHPDRE